MPASVKDSGSFKPLSAYQKINGLWLPISMWQKYQGVWYEANSNGIKVVIDSPTTIYDFNLKDFLISAGLWTPEKPIVITELLITEQTVLTQTVANQRVYAVRGYDGQATPPDIPGYTKVLVPSRREGTATYYNYCVYDQNLSLYAFDTGDGWPTNSRIERLVIQGKVHGRGGNGSGGSNNSTTPFGVLFDGGSRSTLPAVSYVGPSHGWPALRTTLPIKTLSVPGLLAGGGAGGGPRGRAISKTNTEVMNLIDSRPLKLSEMEPYVGPFFLTLCAEPILVSGSAPRDPAPLHSQGTLIMAVSPRIGYHGGGGGQGGAFGGLVNPLPNNYTDSSNYATYVNGVAGTDSPLEAPGTASVANVQVTSAGKYQPARERLFVSSGSFIGGAWGEDTPECLLSSGDLNQANLTAQWWDSGQPARSALIDYGGGVTSTVYFSSRLKSWGGPSIKGVELIQTILNSENIKGRQVPSSYYW